LRGEAIITRGVLSRKAIRLLDSEERNKTPKPDDLRIDLGAEGKADTKSVIAIWDCVTYEHILQRLRADQCVARSFDDNMGAFVAAEALRLLTGILLKAAVIVFPRCRRRLVCAAQTRVPTTLTHNMHR